MRKVVAFSLVVISAAAAFGCSGAPTAPGTATPVTTIDSAEDGASSAPLEGMTKTPIAGTLDFMSQGGPERFRMTPGNMCHYWNFPVYDVLLGDVAGPITFYENLRGSCDGSHFVGSGPFEGHMRWSGREGSIAGQWTTNCKAVKDEGVLCDGTMNARGEGGLEGVQFHFKWGPGLSYPFPYTGTAFAK